MLRRTLSQKAIPTSDVDGVKAAVAHASQIFPSSAEVAIATAAVQAFLENDLHGATSTLQKARSLPAGVAARLTMLLLEKTLRQRQTSEAGDTMDWSTYVELQHSLRFLVAVHRRAVVASRDVWRALLKHEVGLDDVARALRKMDRHQVQADGAYRSMLDRHPRQARLLQVSAAFPPTRHTTEPRLPQ